MIELVSVILAFAVGFCVTLIYKNTYKYLVSYHIAYYDEKNERYSGFCFQTLDYKKGSIRSTEDINEIIEMIKEYHKNDEGNHKDISVVPINIKRLPIR